MIQIKLHDKSNFNLNLSFSKTILIIPKIKQFGYKKDNNWEKIIFDIHFLFIKIYLFLWCKKVKN